MDPDADTAWSVILPVKPLASAKSRIGRGAGSTLALAFFQDTLAAVRGCPRVGEVLVATHDELIWSIASQRGCIVIDDSEHPGINGAAAWAAEHLSPTDPVAVLVSDLPCLTADALSVVVAVASTVAISFVADAGGTGTTMWLSSRGGPVRSHFGVASADAHRRDGAVDLTTLIVDADSIASARRDVDTEDDLIDAIALGVGPFTRTAAGVVGQLIVTALARTPDGDLAVADEDGRRHVIAWKTIAGAGFLEVRPGQRLILEGDAVRLP